VVNCQDFSLFYEEENHRFIALESLSCAFSKGSSTAIIGESGSGKTSFAKALLGVLPPNASTKGAIALEGQAWLEADEVQKHALRQRTIAYMPQGGAENLNPLLSVQSHLEEVLAPRFTCKALLGQVGLDECFLARYPGELSGGEAAKVLLALALASDAPIVVLDEPTAGLDAYSKKAIVSLLTTLNAKQKTLIIITHDLVLAQQTTQNTLVFYMGQLLEQLPSSALFDGALHPYTIALAQVFPREDRVKDIVKIKGEAPFRMVHRHAKEDTHTHVKTHVHVETQGCLYAPRCTQATALCAVSPSLMSTAQGVHACYYEGMRPLFLLENVSFAYPKAKTSVLDGVSMQLKRGEVYALVGSSGSGKSTIAQLVAGMRSPTKGKAAPCEPIRVGMVYQHPMQALSPRLSVLESIAEPLVLAKYPKEKILPRVYEVARRCGLGEDPHLLELSPHKLSLGTLQRVCIARALVNHPDLIIADEPTSALDPSVQARVMKTFLELQVETGVGVLFITHNLALARKIADIIGVLKNGKLVYEGSVEACPHF
jgi:peptide/nickel transport system ATP-binding protein